MSFSIEEIYLLPPAGPQSKQGVFAMYDRTLEQTVQIRLNEALGSERADIEWNAGTTYALDAYVLYQGLLAYQSKVGSNLGNVPAENSFWKEVQISLADGVGLVPWSAGLFTYNASIVVNGNKILQLAKPTPYESTDINAELTAGDWTTLGTTNPASGSFPITGGTFNEKVKSGEFVMELTQAVAYTLPQISTLVDQSYSINLVNISGAQVNVNAFAGDTINGLTAQTVPNNANMKIYISTTTNYQII